MSTLQLSSVSASHPGTPVLHGDRPHGAGRDDDRRPRAFRVRKDHAAARRRRVHAARQPARSAWATHWSPGPRTFVPPERRGFGYVAQEGNLFPHLDVGANIAYGLDRAERRKRSRAVDLLELVGLPGDMAARRPDQLSGGQQQRVALARALARRPLVVLLDEPFSALDPELRVTTREAVAVALRHEKATVVLVTHDQAEALSFADQVAIMHEGRFVQVGPPAEVYRAPRDRRAATSLGEACFLPGVLRGDTVECALGTLPAAPGRPSTSGEVQVVLRPEQLVLRPPQAHGQGPVAEVTRTEFYGRDALVDLRLGSPADGVTLLRARVGGHDRPEVGDTVTIEVLGTAQVIALEGDHHKR